MATKGDRTRRRVIEQAAPVFNTRGYWGSSVRDLMEASGLQKGGIYNHFGSKDELALAAFDHDVEGSALPTTFVAALEGGLMMSQLYGEPRYLDDAVAHLADVVRSLEPRENQ